MSRPLYFFTTLLAASMVFASAFAADLGYSNKSYVDTSAPEVFAVKPPAILMPTDTTPAWLNKMGTPPVFMRANDANNSKNQSQIEQAADKAKDTQSSEPAAEVEAEYIPAVVPNYIEAGINYYNVTNNFGNSFGQFINVQYQTDPWNRWSAGVQHARAFRDEGQAASIGNTHIFNKDWYSDVAASIGSSATFLTRYRVDGSLSRRWLDAGNFITTVGGTWDKANDIYSDRTLRLSAAYYFPSAWVVQAGFNLNHSNPGGVFAPSGFGALTYGFQGRYFLTGRYGFAREAYQLLNSGNIVNSFNSQTIGGNWRQWVGADWGFNLGVELYNNPFYTRTGGIVSVFKEF